MRDALCIFLVVLAACVWLLGGDRLPPALHWASLGALLSTVLAWGVSLVRDRQDARRRVLASVGRSELARHRGALLANQWRRH